MLKEMEKSEIESIWRDVFDILLHHNLICEYGYLDEQWGYIIYYNSNKSKIREINLGFSEGKFRALIYRLNNIKMRGSSDLIEGLAVNSSSEAALVAAHEFRKKECRYCTVRLND